MLDLQKSDKNNAENPYTDLPKLLMEFSSQ